MSLDDRLRRGLSGLASGVDPDADEALSRVVSAGRRRRVVRRLAVAATAAAVLVAGGLVVPRLIQAVGPERSGGFAGDPSPTGKPKREATLGLAIGGRCPGQVAFEPTYLPAGFYGDPISGPAPGAPPAEEGQGVVHWSDGERSVEIRRPGMLFVELAQADDAPTITVLGEETSSFGPVAPNYEDPQAQEYMVQFRYPADAPPVDDHSKDCAFFSLNEYGVGLQELIRVAEGLAPAG